jgi:hypothetical protein
MSNAKQKRAVAAHIEFRKRKLPFPVVTVSRPHETTAVAVGAKVRIGKNGKPLKRKGCIVSWRKVETTARAALVESPCSMGRRPNYEWYSLKG